MRPSRHEQHHQRDQQRPSRRRMRDVAAATVLVALSLFTPRLAETQQPERQPPRLVIQPSEAAPGALVQLALTLAPRAANGDSLIATSGTMAGEPLHFFPAPDGTLAAMGAVPIDVTDSLVARVVTRWASGTADTVRATLRFPHEQAAVADPSKQTAATTSKLAVNARFTRRSKADDARVARENELARGIGRKARDTPKLWTKPFLKPRSSVVTSEFGSGRNFNGTLTSSHQGVDFRGKVGEPILAANRGVVALVGQFLLAGNVVYIDHGNGVVTGYFHMSKPLVAKGDTVERGQRIGLVGATGRVTGPHLHWSARFGVLTVNPSDLLTLTPPFAAPGSR